MTTHRLDIWEFRVGNTGAHLSCINKYNPGNPILLTSVLTHLRVRQNSLHFDIFKNIFLMKMYELRLKFHWSLFRRVQITIFQYWIRKWLGVDRATCHYLNQWLDYQHINASLALNELTHPPQDHDCGDITSQKFWWFSMIILGMGSANERKHYYVTPSLIGWAHTQNDPWFPWTLVLDVVWYNIAPRSFEIKWWFEIKCLFRLIISGCDKNS